MPYIIPELRKRLDTSIHEMVNCLTEHRKSGQAGQLNYVIARIVFRLLRRQGWKYSLMNEFIGALECCKLEIYRRLVADYEDIKMEENGDVFGV